MVRLSNRIFLIALFALVFVSLALTSNNAWSKSANVQNRVRDAFTAWDNEYFYAGFQVTDSNVVSKNDSPTSRPQEDDDIEVFIETDGARNATSRTPATYQMAVSAASGAYFSVGDGTAVPHPKTVLTYKFASTVEGTLNSVGDKDTGYTIEMAIPWDVLGLSGPPQPGTQFGFNVISRDRDSISTPATTAYSLSTRVAAAADIQNPSKWTTLEFAGGATAGRSTPDHIFCARISDPRYTPVIDGVLSSGEWPLATRFGFGDLAFVLLQARRKSRISRRWCSNRSQFTVRLHPSHQRRRRQHQFRTRSRSRQTRQAGQTTTSISQAERLSTLEKRRQWCRTRLVLLPDVPGPPTPPKPPKHPKVVITSRPDQPLVTGEKKPAGMPEVDFTGAAPLPAQTRVPQLVFADYYLSTDTNSHLVGLDQPADPGVVMSDVLSITGQIHDAANSGVDALLVHYSASRPGDYPALLRLVAALKLLRQRNRDYPLIALRAEGSAADVITFFSAVPATFRAQTSLPDSAGNARAYIAIVDDKNLTEDLEKAFRGAFGDRAGLFLTSYVGSDICTIKTVSPGGKSDSGTLIGRAKATTYIDSWKAAGEAAADWVVVSSLNDYVKGTEIAGSREYGDQYMDLTRVNSLAIHGEHPWSASFAQNDCPAIINPGALTAVSIRVKNTGTVAWRTGDNYALAYRWYRDGALYDDSAPRYQFCTRRPSGRNSQRRRWHCADQLLRQQNRTGRLHAGLRCCSGQHTLV